MRSLAGSVERLVAKAIDSLPEPLRERLEKIEIVIESVAFAPAVARHADTARRTRCSLTYEGVPRPIVPAGYGMVLLDKITIFQGPIEQLERRRTRCGRRCAIRSSTSTIAHFFGTSDDQLRRMGAY